MPVLGEMIEDELFGIDANEIHERSRDERELLARRIDEIPMSFKGESLDIERD